MRTERGQKIKKILNVIYGSPLKDNFFFFKYFPGHDHGECSILEGRIKALRNISEFCKDHRTEFIGEEVRKKEYIRKR